MSRILIIDGSDGAGKQTIAKEISARLRKADKVPLTVSPPFYDTNSGMVVKEYLTTGYGFWTSRLTASLLYSTDRAMYMRDNFDCIATVASDHYNDQPVIFDRSWLSNVIHQTTMIAQTKEDDHQLTELKYWYPLDDAGKGKEYGFQRFKMSQARDVFENDGIILSYDGSKAEVFEALTANRYHEIKQFYRNYRAAIVRQMIRQCWDLEIAQFTLDGEDGKPYPWTEFQVIRPIILVPHLEVAVERIKKNLLYRYHGDLSQLDRNEVNERYQLAVVENIHWIHKNWAFIAHPTSWDKLPAHSSYNQYMPNAPESLDRAMEAPFRFDLVYITDSKGEMRPVEEIADEVWDKYMNH